MKKRKRIQKKLGKLYQKNKKQFSRTDRLLFKLLIFEINRSESPTLRILVITLIKWLISFFGTDSRPGSFFMMIHIPYSLFSYVQISPEIFYEKALIPKKKFGDFQRNDDGSIKERLVCKPFFSLKTVQKKLNKYLNKYDLPNNVYGGVPGRNNFLNAVQHINNKYFFRVDLKDFFGRISNSKIHHTLINRGFTWGEARTVTRIATLNGSLPQGAPTSTTLANLVIAPLAIALEQFCSENNIVFTVFVDDLTFSSPKPFKHHTGKILELIQSTKITVNHKKISYRTRCCEITGIFINNGKLFLPKEIIKNSKKTGVKEYIESFNKQYTEYLESKSRLESIIVITKGYKPIKPINFR